MIIISTCRSINMGVLGALSHIFCQCEDCLGKILLLNACACCIMLCILLLRVVINSILIMKNNREAFKMLCVSPLSLPPTTHTHTHPHPISFYTPLTKVWGSSPPAPLPPLVTCLLTVLTIIENYRPTVF